MRVVHSLGWYFPDSHGGTENYVEGLVKALANIGVEGKVLAGRNGETSDRYLLNGIDTLRYPVFSPLDTDELRGLRPHRGFEEFQRALKEERPDIYHQHTWSRGCGIHHLRYARSLGLHTVLTVHVAGNFCLRGTMMLFGESACDGEILERRCSACWAKARGWPGYIANRLWKVPFALSEFSVASRYMKMIGSGLATRALVLRHRNALAEASLLSDKIVCVSKWIHEAMILNGVPSENLYMCPHGVSGQMNRLKSGRPKANRVCIGFFGRADPIKGLHILVKAVASTPRDLPLELRVFAISEDETARKYLDQLKALAREDQRIRFEAPVPRRDLSSILAGLDVLAVPSQCLETGPLVVLEAQHAGLPVIGSDLGGIQEKIKHGVNGLLVPHADVSLWTEILVSLVRDRHLLGSLRANVEPPRSNALVAEEMKDLYQEISLRNQFSGTF